MRIPFGDSVKRFIMHFGKGFSWKECLIFVFFAMIASVFWWVHTLDTPHEITLRLQADYTGLPDNIELEKALPAEYQVTITDNGKHVREFSRNQQVMRLDLSHATPSERGELNIPAEVLRAKVVDILPATSQLENILPEQVHTTYYRQQSKEVSVRFAGTLLAASEYQQTGEIKLEPQRIRIFGKKEVLASISSIETESTTFTNLSETNRLRVALISPAGVRLGNDSVTVEVEMERYTEKIFHMPIATRKVPSGNKMHLFPSVADVTVRIGTKHFQDVSETDIDVWCEYPTEHSNQIPVHVNVNTPYASDIRVTPDMVEYLVEQQ